MRSDVVVLSEPLINDDLRLLSGREPGGVEDLVAPCSVEPLIVSVLPWRAWVDLNRFDPNPCQPCLQRRCNELWTIAHREEALSEGYGHLRSHPKRAAAGHNRVSSLNSGITQPH